MYLAQKTLRGNVKDEVLALQAETSDANVKAAIDEYLATYDETLKNTEATEKLLAAIANDSNAHAKEIIKNKGAIDARQQLFGDQEGRAVLDDDVEFPSPSAAAVFVLGGSQNGWTEWVNDRGQTLDSVYRSKE